MNIEYSTKDRPLDRVRVENVTSYIQTDSECLIFQAEGLWGIILEEDIEDWLVHFNDR